MVWFTWKTCLPLFCSAVIYHRGIRSPFMPARGIDGSWSASSTAEALTPLAFHTVLLCAQHRSSCTGDSRELHVERPEIGHSCFTVPKMGQTGDFMVMFPFLTVRLNSLLLHSTHCNAHVCTALLLYVPAAHRLALKPVTPPKLQNCCPHPSEQWDFQHHKLVTCLPQLNLWPLWVISLPPPLFHDILCYLCFKSFERGKKPNKVTQTHQGISFSLPALLTLVFPDAGAWGIHLVSLAISSFIDCTWVERYLLILWSNPNTFLPDEMCHQTNSLSKFPCRGTYPWTWPSVTHSPGTSPARNVYS